MCSFPGIYNSFCNFYFNYILHERSKKDEFDIFEFYDAIL